MAGTELPALAPERWVVICCPVSGKKNAEAVVRDELLPAMKKEGLAVEVVNTKSKGHATELAELHGSAACGLIAVGGDGTIHEVMDGLIKAGKLAEVPLALLSQGTMNFYAVSGALPSARALPAVLKRNNFRMQGLMRCSMSAPGQKVSNAPDAGHNTVRCFEALYFGLGYGPAKAAQEWRDSCCGPMGGILSKLTQSNWNPEKHAAITGTLRLTDAASGAARELQDTFVWIVVTQRSPYNGALTADMWVSWLTLKNFPGFKRMMDFFAPPPMELFTGTAAVFDGHLRVSRVEWRQTAPAGGVGICLDGDPVTAGSSVVIDHEPAAWRIMADAEYPTSPPSEVPGLGPTRLGWVTPAAARWLAEHGPAAAGQTMAAPATHPACCCRVCCPPCSVYGYGGECCSLPMLGALLLGCLYTATCWAPPQHWPPEGRGGAGPKAQAAP